MTQPKKCLISDIYHVRNGVGSIGIMGSMPLTDMNYHDLRVSAITQAAHHWGGRRQAEMFDYQYDTSFLTEGFAEHSEEQHYAELARTAVTIAAAAAKVIAERRAAIENLQAVTTTKSSDVDPVTIVDTAAEEVIRTMLTELRPGDGMIGEEGTATTATTGVTWIVDPIDGTVNFLYNQPQYAVSLAAEIDHTPVAGVVLNVVTGQLWVASKNGGAITLGPHTPPRLITASTETSLTLSLVATGFSYSAARRKKQVEILGELIGTIRDIRRRGSAALDLCAVADGQVEAYYEHATNVWDYAAGVLVALEAGAVVETPRYGSPHHHETDKNLVWACAPGIVRQFATVMRKIPTALPDNQYG